MIAVKIYFNTDENNFWVDENTKLENWPMCVYGPFDDIQAAIDWMENDYPDGDTDVHDMIADDFDIPEGWHVNSPDAFKDGSAADPVNPDVDIRTESQEIHVP